MDKLYVALAERSDWLPTSAFRNETSAIACQIRFPGMPAVHNDRKMKRRTARGKLKQLLFRTAADHGGE